MPDFRPWTDEDFDRIKSDLACIHKDTENRGLLLDLILQRGLESLQSPAGFRRVQCPPTVSGFQHRDRLLQQIADGLKGHGARLRDLEVLFQVGDVVCWRGGVGQAIDALVNELTWDEEGEYAAADLARVRVL